MRPQTTYYLMRAGVAYLYNMWLTVTLLYHATVITEDPLRLILLGVAHEATVFLFEIPTGVVADTYSRKWSVVTGLAVTGVAFALEGAFAIYATVFLAQILHGIGFTFYSGANDAWLADEMGPDRAAPVFVRGTQISLLAGQGGILSAIVIGQAGLNTPLLAAGIGMAAMGIYLAFVMTEHGFKPEHSSAGVWGKLIGTFRRSLSLLERGKGLALVVFVGFVVGLSVGGYDRLYTPHFLLNFKPPLEPIVWFGLLSAAVSVSATVILQWIRRRATLISAERVPRLIAALYGGTILGNVVFVLAGQFELAVMAYWFSQMMRATTRPLIIIWISQITPSQFRASAISMYWQSISLGNVLGAPVIGLIGTVTSVRWALMAAVLALSPTLWLLTRRVRGTETPHPLAPSPTRGEGE
jgi:DHA3 family tetracycline resistance protein-like MFS transporter